MCQCVKNAISINVVKDIVKATSEGSDVAFMGLLDEERMWFVYCRLVVRTAVALTHFTRG